MSEPTEPPRVWPFLSKHLFWMLGAAVLAGTLSKVTSGVSVIVFGLGWFIQVGVLVLLALVRLVKGGQQAGVYFLTAAVLLLIGAGTCGTLIELSDF